MTRGTKIGLFVAAGALVALGVAAAVFATWSQHRPLPTASVAPELGVVGHAGGDASLAVAAPSGRLRSLEVRVAQGDREQTLLHEDVTTAATADASRTIHLDPNALGLDEGPAELRVFVEDAAWRPRPPVGPRLHVPFTVDLTPPGLELRAVTGYVAQAGAGVAVYRATGATRSGVRVGGRDFEGTAGLAPDADVRVALFTLPYDAEPAPPSLFARDDAGNEKTVALPVRLLPGRSGTDTVNLTEAFLRRKVPELAPRASSTATADELLAAFLTVNREGRAAAEAKIREASSGAGEAKPLWSGAFRQQPSTKVFADFPQRREYRKDGAVVDTQWHLGLDLASNERSAVLASNAGRVAFTGDNGIYGNLVILDHGLGLYSLYGHLSEIGVTASQHVAQGDTIGHSGQTGLAGGDHLHFAMLIHGTYTGPRDWWDASYIRDRIAQPLLDAGLSLPGVTDVGAGVVRAGATTKALEQKARKAETKAKRNAHRAGKRAPRHRR